MAESKQGSEWAVAIDPSLAKLDDERWLHPWRNRAHSFGRVVLQHFAAAGTYALYPNREISAVIDAQHTPDGEA